MVTKIALFNHKGGVSKTTTTFHLGWMLAELGKKVIIVDTDPQCNLTGMVLGFSHTELESFYSKNADNIKKSLSPAFDSEPKLITSTDCLAVPGRDGLFLLPGHLELSEYEVTLGIAQSLSSTIYTLRNLPGAINYLLEKTAEKYSADYILIDMSPSLSAINQNLLMISDYFIVPTSPDYYSTMAIESLSKILPKWRDWSLKIQNLPEIKESAYPFPDVTPKFLGTIIQKYTIRKGKPSKGFSYWINEINKSVESKLSVSLIKKNMFKDRNTYPENFCLSTISDFNTLIAKSQEFQKPVFGLSKDEIQQVGKVLDDALLSVNKFHGQFKALGENVIKMTSNG